MERGEVWWAKLPSPMGQRPVVLLSRDRAYLVRNSVTVAQVTTTIHGIPVEVPLGPAEGLPKICVVNLDSIFTISKNLLVRPLTLLPPHKLADLDRALKYALGLK